MIINKRLLPLKAHIFLYFGCMAPILPFVLVLALQLGIPLPLQGTLSAFALLFTIVGKPLIAALADAFPSYRKVIFLVILGIMVISFSAIEFIPPIQKPFHIRGRLINVNSLSKNISHSIADNASTLGVTTNKDSTGYGHSTSALRENELPFQHSTANSVKWKGTKGSPIGELLFIAYYKDVNSGSVSGKECTFTRDPRYSNTTTKRGDDVYFNINLIPWNTVKKITSNLSTEDTKELLLNHETQASEYTIGNFSGNGLYQIEGIQLPVEYSQGEVSILCLMGDFESEDGNSERALQSWQFWLLAVFLIAGQMAFNTSVSITDAITVDSTENEGSYGVQRAWGTIGWGLLAPISGLLVDWWSGDSNTKDYSPAFLLCFSLGALDLILSAAYLRVPSIKDDTNILKNLRPLLKQCRFFIFCCFVILNGLFDGIVVNFIFIMQEDMAKGTSAVDNMKFLQGLTILVQSIFEAPFMFIHGWFMKKLGAQKCTSLVFFTYIFRLLGLFVVGKYGSVWATLLPELLNGPCYGLGYTAIVVYAAQIAPTGTSNTVQSVVNICYESFGYALSMFLGGLVYNAVGGPFMYLMASGVAVCTFICHVISLRVLSPPQETSETKRYMASKQDLSCDDQEESKSLKITDAS